MLKQAARVLPQTKIVTGNCRKPSTNILDHPIHRFMASKAPDAKQKTGENKYCATCGRLISPNHRNFYERKYCSKSCSSSKPNETDRQIEDCFRKMAVGHGQITCDEIQRHFEQTSEPYENDQEDKQKIGMAAAKIRERIRRAGRRVVVFPHSSGHSFESIQDGKPVEASFAKGEWAVRCIRQQPV